MGLIRAWLARGLGFLLKRLRPREGWGVLLSLMTLALTPAAALRDAHWLGEGWEGHGAAMLGLWVGLMGARHIRSRWLAHALWLALALGVGALIWVPFTWPLAAWLSAWQTQWIPLWSHPSGPLPLPFLRGLAGTLLFAAGAIAAWRAFRLGDAWGAALGPAVLLIGIVFFAHNGYFWPAVFIFAFVLLAATLHLARDRWDWERRRVDYSPEIGLDLTITAVVLALSTSLLALAAPNLTISPLTRAFWRVWAEPYAGLEARVSPWFSQLQRPPRGLIGGGQVTPAQLPRAHLLGGRPELTEQIIMTVQVDDPSPDALTFWSDYRWRGPTYAIYTGQGWENPEPRDIQHLAAGETWLRIIPADRRPLRQEFRFLAGRPYWLYAAGEPMAADIPSRAFLLDPNSLMGMTARTRGYTVLSQVPIFHPEHLRQAPNDYPPEMAVYLQLPETLPLRVRTLARQITAETTNPYDAGMALQTYLRQRYPYSLDIPLPPAHTDVTAYFLFQLQKGYCDYYATAMVVMARSLGIPARLAVGYAPGTYDARRRRLIVREKDAHSWPELYFPGYGWIPFEPTPARPLFQPQPQLRRPQEVNQQDARVIMQALRAQGRRRQYLVWGGVLSLWLVLLLGGYGVWQEWRLRRLAPDPWLRAWLRLQRLGRWFHISPAPWLTPAEVATHWARTLASAQPPPPPVVRLLHEVQALATQMENRVYAPPQRHPQDQEAARAWRRVRGAALRAWFFIKFK